MALTTSPDSRFPERVSQALEEAAKELESFSNDQSVPRFSRYLFLRYGPFLRELSGRSYFCKELSDVQLTDSLSMSP